MVREFEGLGAYLPPDLRVEVHFNPIWQQWVANFSDGGQVRATFADALYDDCIAYIKGYRLVEQMPGYRAKYEPEPEGDES